MTQTANPETESVAGNGAVSPPANADPRGSLGAAMLRLQGEAAATEPSRESLNAADQLAEPDAGNAADLSVNPDADTDTDGEPRGSRRISATQRELDTLKAELAEIKGQIQPTQSPASDPDDPITKAEATIAKLKGTDDEWRDLQSRVVDGLNFEEAERFRRMQAARDFEAEWNSLAEARTGKQFGEYRNGFFESVAGHFAAVAQKPGVDPDFVQGNPDMGKVFEHIYDAGRKDLVEENELLKGENKDLKRQLAGNAPRLALGGRSTLGVPSRPDPQTADPTDLLAAGMAQRAAAAKRTKG